MATKRGSRYRQQALDTQPHWCAACKTPLPASALEADHVQALWRNGPDDWTRLLCKDCHREKSAADAAEKAARERARRPRPRRARGPRMRIPKFPTGDVARWLIGGALVAAAIWWLREPGDNDAKVARVRRALPGADTPRARSGAQGGGALDGADVARWLIGGAVALVVLVALVLWLRWRAAERAEVLERLGDALARETHTDPLRMAIRVRRWSRMVPVHASARYSSLFDDEPGSAGRAKVEALLTRKIGARLDIHWRPHRDTVTWRPAVGEPDEQPDEPEQESSVDARHAKVRERVEDSVRAAIKGDVAITWGATDAVGPLRLTVAYPSAFNDESPEVRQTLADRVNNKAPGRWKATWDTEENRVRFDRRPPMPKSIPNPVTADRDSWRIPFGVDESGEVVEWSLRAAPHALVVGGTGTGKTVTLRSIITDACARGFTVFCVDPKRIELTGLRDWPGVRAVASSTEEMIALVAMLADEMDARYAAIEAGEVTEADLAPVLLVLDEAREFIDRANAHWKANKRGAGSEHPVIERWRSMARLGRSGRVHLAVGIQRPDAKVFGGEARDNYAFRVALGAMSQEGARMVFGRADVGRDIPAGTRGRATVGRGEDVTEVQTYYTPNPRAVEDAQEQAHLAALHASAAQSPSTAVAHINADTIAAYAEAMDDPEAPLPVPPKATRPRSVDGPRQARRALATAKAQPDWEQVRLDDLDEGALVLIDEDGVQVEATLLAAPCESAEDPEVIEVDYRRTDGVVGMVAVDSDHQMMRRRDDGR